MQTWQRRPGLFRLRDLGRINRADDEHERRNRLIRQTVFTEILATHRRIFAHDVVFADGRFQCRRHPLDQLGIVVGRARELVLAHAHFWQLIWRQTRRASALFRDPFDRGQHFLAHLLFVSAHGQLHFHFVGNNVVFRPAVDRADRDHDRIERIIFARGNRLPRIDNFGRENNRVLRLVRVGAVAADAMHRHID